MLKGLIKPDLNAREPAARLTAIEKLSDPSEHQSELAALVQNDSDEAVRLAALARLSEVSRLSELVVALIEKTPGATSNKVTSALHKQFIAVLRSEGQGKPAAAELREILASGSPECRLLICCGSNDAEIRNEALAGIEDQQQLARIVCEAQHHPARLAAAERLQQTDVMQQCLSQIKNRDKVTARHLQERLSAQQREVEQVELHQASVRQITASMKSLSESVWSPQYAGQFAALEQRWAALQPVPSNDEIETFRKHTDPARKKVGEFKSQQNQLDQCRATLEQVNDSVNALCASELSTLSEAAKAARVVADSSPQAWKGATENLTADNTYAADYETARKKLAGLLKSSEAVVAADAAKKADASAIETALADDVFVASMACVPELRTKLGSVSQQIEKDQHRQTQLVEGLGKQLNSLAATIASGKWGPAEGMSVRIQRKLDQIDDKSKKSLQARFDSQRKKLDELADWQDFAAKPKLEALVKSMQELPAKSIKPRALADEIKALQNQWKELGNCRAANQLWPDFKQAGDTAYVPCKEYFEGLKKQRDARAANRLAVCERLEAFAGISEPAPGEKPGEKSEEKPAQEDSPENKSAAEKPDEKSSVKSATKSVTTAGDTSDWKAMQRLISDAQREWRNNAPGGKRQNKQLENRFNSAVARIDDLIAPHFEAGETERKEIIEKTRKLTEADINQHAINQAKRLQAAWKLCGPASRREDRKLWTEFNDLCGQIFGKHREDQRAQYKASMAHVDRAREIVKTIRSMGRDASDQEEKQFSELQDEFRNLAEFPEKVKKGLLRDFRNACDGYSSKRSNLGKKQEQQELTSMRQLAQICEQLETGILDFQDLQNQQSKKEESAPAVQEKENVDADALADEATDSGATDTETVDTEATSGESESTGVDASDSAGAGAATGTGEGEDGVEVSEQAKDANETETTKPDTPESSKPVDTSDDPDSWTEQWKEMSESVPKPWLKRISKRRDASIKILEKGESPFNDKNNDARRLHCIKLEIARDVETPTEDKALRMQYQLEQLQSGPDSALRDTNKELLRNYEVDWLCLPPASPDIAASLEQRFRNALGS